MRRGASLLIVGLLWGSNAAAQEPEYFEPPPSQPKFTLRWEALFRYDFISQLRVRPDIERGRFEVRPELAFAPSDRFKAAVRAVANLGTDDNRENGRNFDNYRSLRIQEMPEVEVVIVRSAEKPTGVGEPGVPPIAPAVANAIARLQERPRRLPFVRRV